MKKKNAVRSKRSYKKKEALSPSSAKQKREVQKGNDLFGFMAGKFEIVGDIESRLPDWECRDRANKLEK
jgi:hypothetical protein